MACNRCGASRTSSSDARFYITDPPVEQVYTISLKDNRRMFSYITNQQLDLPKNSWFQIYESDLAKAIRGGLYGVRFETVLAESTFLSRHEDIQQWTYQ